MKHLPRWGLPEIFEGIVQEEFTASNHMNGTIILLFFFYHKMSFLVMSQACKLGFYLCCAKLKKKLKSAPRSKNDQHSHPLAKLCFQVSQGPCDLGAAVQL